MQEAGTRQADCGELHMVMNGRSNQVASLAHRHQH